MINETLGDYEQSHENTNSESEFKANNRADSKSKWIRALYMLVFIFVLGIVQTIVNVLAIVIFVIKLFGNSKMERAVEFGGVLADYAQQIICFLTYKDEQLPWPFNELAS